MKIFFVYFLSFLFFYEKVAFSMQPLSSEKKNEETVTPKKILTLEDSVRHTKKWLSEKTSKKILKKEAEKLITFIQKSVTPEIFSMGPEKIVPTLEQSIEKPTLEEFMEKIALKNASKNFVLENSFEKLSLEDFSEELTLKEPIKKDSKYSLAHLDKLEYLVRMGGQQHRFTLELKRGLLFYILNKEIFHLESFQENLVGKDYLTFLLEKEQEIIKNSSRTYFNVYDGALVEAIEIEKKLQGEKRQLQLQKEQQELLWSQEEEKELEETP